MTSTTMSIAGSSITSATFVVSTPWRELDGARLGRIADGRAAHDDGRADLAREVVAPLDEGACDAPADDPKADQPYTDFTCHGLTRVLQRPVDVTGGQVALDGRRRALLLEGGIQLDLR